VSSHKAILKNITDATDAIIGKSAFAQSSGIANESIVDGIITITSAKAFQIQHRCSSTQSANGFGVAFAFGNSEVFTVVQIIKLQ
jgi:hypothetical protein